MSLKSVFGIKERLPMQRIEIIGKSDIEQRIAELKEELNRVYENHYEKLYNILNEILVLRQKQIKNYTQSRLAYEKGINLSSSQISYIFIYRFISPFSKEMIRSKKIKEATVIYIIRQRKKFRTPALQDKAVKMYLSGKMTTRMISKLKNEKVFDGKVTPDVRLVAEQQFVTMYDRLGVFRTLIKEKGHLMKDVALLRSIRLQLESLRRRIMELERKAQQKKR